MTCLYFFQVTGRCIPLRTFHWIIFNILSMSACFDKNFYTSLPVLIRLSNSGGSYQVFNHIWHHTILIRGIFFEVHVKIHV